MRIRCTGPIASPAVSEPEVVGAVTDGVEGISAVAAASETGSDMTGGAMVGAGRADAGVT